MQVHATLAQLKHISILDFHANLGLHQLGAGPKDCVTVGVPIFGQVPRWKDATAASGALLSFGSGTAFEGVTSDEFRGLTFSISAPYYSDLCRKIGVAETSMVREFGLISEAGDSKRYGMIARTVLESFAQNESPFAEAFEDEIACALILAMAGSSGELEDRSTPKTREMARRRAIEVMEFLAPEAARISYICEQSGVAWRTLDRAFLEYFGFGPKTYFEFLRLARVREELMLHGPEAQIAEIANSWGFWHMGKFARDYRNLFHELPSETRRRGKWQVN